MFNEDKEEQNLSNFASNVGKRLLVTAVSSPIEYAKILIQIGFEPIPPKPTKTIFGKPALGLPNVLSYANYIRNIDGTVGWFNGLTPRLCSTFLITITHSYAADRFPIKCKDKATVDEKQKVFVKTLARNVVAASTAVVISHPFHVVAVRMMAQFIGRETKYNGLFSSLITVYKEEGLSGWFSGLVPRLLGEVTALFCFSSVSYLINTYLLNDDKNKQQLTSICVDYFVRNLFYPFQVISVCMSVNGSGLRAGSPPLMPNYSGSWVSCWDDLVLKNETKRGSSLFWRHHTIQQPVKPVFIPLPELDVPKYK